MSKKDYLTPLKAHRIRCLKCYADSHKAVRDCDDYECESHDFRMGHDPRRQGISRNRATLVRKSRSGRFSPTHNGNKSVQRIVTDGKYEVIVRKIEKKQS